LSIPMQINTIKGSSWQYDANRITIDEFTGKVFHRLDKTT